jgi:hypothetical protein
MSARIFLSLGHRCFGPSDLKFFGYDATQDNWAMLFKLSKAPILLEASIALASGDFSSLGKQPCTSRLTPKVGLHCCVVEFAREENCNLVD